MHMINVIYMSFQNSTEYEEEWNPSGAKQWLLWSCSVRELQRQIDSNYYFRSGWSQKPEALAELVEGKAETDTLALDIKSPFTFEFLGLQAKDVVEESDLETALITHLQDFILELGMGFCFEERQKKMLIDDRSCVRKMRDYIIRYRSSKIR